MKKEDNDHVMLWHIPHNSFINYKPRGNVKPRINRYNNLLQVTVRNQAIIYDLDYLNSKGKKYFELRNLKTGIPEVNYLEHVDQFTNPNKFVNTGFFNAFSIDENFEDD